MARSAHSLVTVLQPHMFSVDAMQSIASMSSNPDPDHTAGASVGANMGEGKTSPKRKRHTPDNLWTPPYQDKLFWSFYYLLMGDHSYEEARKHSFRIEREMKIAAVEVLRTNSELLKWCPFKINELETELVGSRRITYKGLYALCFVHSVSIIYVKDRTYMTVIGEGSVTWKGLIVHKDGITGLRRTSDGNVIPTAAEISDIENKLYWIGNPNKPIKALSAYGLRDLGIMAERLCVSIIGPDGKKKLKKQLYEDITAHL